jgi:hypothetical protein
VDQHISQDRIGDLEIFVDEEEKSAVGNSMAFEVIGLASRTFGPPLSLVDAASAIGDVISAWADA